MFFEAMDTSLISCEIFVATAELWLTFSFTSWMPCVAEHYHKGTPYGGSGRQQSQSDHGDGDDPPAIFETHIRLSADCAAGHKCAHHEEQPPHIRQGVTASLPPALLDRRVPVEGVPIHSGGCDDP